MTGRKMPRTTSEVTHMLARVIWDDYALDKRFEQETYDVVHHSENSFTVVLQDGTQFKLTIEVLPSVEL